MEKLIPYNEKSSSSIQLQADFSVQGKNIFLDYRLTDPGQLVSLNPEQSRTSDVPRKDELWTATCFEAFLRVPGKDSYYEFNFSTDPAWNAYAFTGYRTPQPPAETKDFRLMGLIWKEGHLQVELENLTPYNEFEVSLTAVLQFKDLSKTYWAVAHKGPQPDFHHVDSFVLRRGASL